MTDGRHMRRIIGKADLVTTISIHDIDFPFPSRSEEKAILPGVPEGGGMALVLVLVPGYMLQEEATLLRPKVL
ncbi:unnamed protein product [marine sediment metagenome]|uniref:Uncharacterized protein n=1 Tax=marine sediment metagenome TaxID=412755 RepID=X1QVY8_9ZZZZ